MTFNPFAPTIGNISPPLPVADGGTGAGSVETWPYDTGAWQIGDYGFLAATGPIESAGTSAIMIAGTVYLQRMIARVPLTVTNLSFRVSTAGAGASSGSFAGLYSAAGSLLSATADLGASLTTANVKTAPLGAAQQVAAGAVVYIGMVVNLATTQPTVNCIANSSQGAANMGLAGAGLRTAVNGTLQTSLPASIVPANNVPTAALPLWFGLS